MRVSTNLSSENLIVTQKILHIEGSHTKGLFTWSGGPRSSGVGFFCFHALGDTKQKKPTLLDRGTPLHVNRILVLFESYGEKKKLRKL